MSHENKMTFAEYEIFHLEKTNELINKIREKAKELGREKEFAGYSWIKIKSFKYDKNSCIDANYLMLEIHHAAEVNFLTRKLEELGKKNIVLAGLMGTGKTTVGKKIAKQLYMDFIDTDELIEQKLSMPISEIFEEYGEDDFRKFENEIFETLIGKTNTVIAIGGGSFLNGNNFKIAFDLGFIYLLEANSSELFKRLCNEVEKRPILGKIEDFSVEKIDELKIKRLSHYNKIKLDEKTKLILTSNKTPKEVADEIIKDFQ